MRCETAGQHSGPRHSPAMAAPPDLVALNEELQALRATGARLSRVPAGTPGAPFPLVVRLAIDRPPAAAAYDVEALQVVAQIAAGAAAAGTSATERRRAVDVRVSSPALPAPVADAASALLAQLWVEDADKEARNNGATPPPPLLGLARLPTLTARHYTSLLTCVPGAVEGYEATDGAGVSVRRFAVVGDARAVAAPAPARPPPRATHATPAAAELAFLRRRFGTALVLDEREMGWEGGSGAGGGPATAGDGLPPALPCSATTFSLTLQPTDPAWPSRTPLRLTGSLGLAYPAAGALTLALAPPVASSRAPLTPAMAALVSAHLARTTAAAAGQPHALRDAVKYVEARAAQLAAAAGEALAGAGRTAGGGESGSESDDDGGHDAGHDDFDHSKTAPSSSTPASIARPSDAARPARRCTLHLTALTLDGVDALSPAALALQAVCDRCGGGVDILLDASAGRAEGAAVCGRCGAAVRVAARALVAHAGNNALDRLDIWGGAPADLLPSTLGAQCGACGMLGALRGVQVGARAARACGACHTPMSIIFQGAAFEDARPAASPARPTSRAGPSGPPPPGTAPGARGGLSPGNPLPATGTCAHYRHSHRWLRFPCCGRLYPCDLCHEIGADHDLQWAKRHVCGWCSVEQSIADTCKACGKKLTGSSASGTAGTRTRHWEGGAGCRDRARLDRRDAAKHRGSAAKTASRKAERVGVEGARRRREKEVG